jgi:hypothetical protein
MSDPIHRSGFVSMLDPGFRIPDPTTTKKRRVKNIDGLSFFAAINFINQKKFYYCKLSEIWVGAPESGIRDLGSRKNLSQIRKLGSKSTESRILVRNTDFFDISIKIHTSLGTF